MPVHERVMVIGSSGAGKSTLLSALRLGGERVLKTEMVQFNERSIDTPGEFLDHRYLGLLLQNAQRAKLVLFVMDPTQDSRFPPAFDRAMKTRVLGVVTKLDVASPEQRLKARMALSQAGAEEVMECSASTGEGIEELKDRIGQLVRNP